MRGYAWLCAVMRGYARLCGVMRGYARLCAVVCGYVRAPGSFRSSCLTPWFRPRLIAAPVYQSTSSPKFGSAVLSKNPICWAGSWGIILRISAAMWLAHAGKHLGGDPHANMSHATYLCILDMSQYVAFGQKTNAYYGTRRSCGKSPERSEAGMVTNFMRWRRQSIEKYNDWVNKLE